MISDHCPLLLGLHELIQGIRRFHFESYWTRIEGFMEEVQQYWLQPLEYSCPLQCFAGKLKRLSKHLQSWSQKKVGNIKRQLLMAKEILHRLEIARDSRSLSPQEEWLRQRLKHHSLALVSIERTIARLRSRLLWMKEGDANTDYFHQQAKYRKKNFIGKIQVEDRLIVDQKEKKEVVWDFYNTLLGMVPLRVSSLNLEAFHRCPMNLQELEQMVTEDEVCHTIRSLPSDKAPGPDGYTGRFYKKV
jgi:hypothetical protein